MSLREALKSKQKKNNQEKNIEFTFEQFKNGTYHSDTEMLALESKVSDLFSLNIIDKIKSILPFGKKHRLRKDLLEYIDIIKSDIDKTVLPILNYYKKEKDVLKSFEKTKEWDLLKDSYHLNVNKLEDVITKTETYLTDFSKHYTEIKKIIETKFTDTLDTKSLNGFQLAFKSYLDTVHSSCGFILDLLSTLADISINIENNKEPYDNIEKNIDKLNAGSNHFRDKILKSSVEEDLKELKEIKPIELYTALENGGSVTELCGKVINKFIGNPIYHIRKFILEVILAYSDYLRQRKNFLECVLIEKQAELNKEPENAKLQKQVAYYADEISKLEAKIEKLEKI